MAESSTLPNGLVERVENLLFRNRRLVIAGFILATVAMAIFASRLAVDAGFTKQIPVKHEYMHTFLEYRDEIGGADHIAIAIMARDGDIFTEEFLDVLRQTTDAVFFLPGIDRVQVRSLVTPNVRFAEVVEDGIIGGNVLPADFVPDTSGFSRLRANIIKSGIVGRLVANDFTGALISAKLQEFHPLTGERLDYLEVSDALEQIRDTAEAAADVDVHIIGFAMIVGEIARGAGDVILFFGITLAITALFVWIYARSIRLTVMALSCSLIAVVWQLGLLAAFGYGIDPMSILVPFLVFAIGVSHGVQMVGTARAEIMDGAEAETAARAAFRRLLLPGAVALASDCIGFVTISLIEVQAIREIAIAAGLGVAAIVLTNLGLLPVLLSYVSLDETQRQAGRARSARLAPIWSFLSVAAHRKPALAIVAIATVLAVAGGHYAQQVRVGDQHRGVPELRASSTYNRDADAIGRHFEIGVDVLTVVTETIADGCVENDIMQTLDDFVWRIRNVEGVLSAISLANVARAVNAGWNEGNLKWRTLPRNANALAKSVSVAQTSSGLLNGDCSVMPVMIFTADHKSETITRIVNAVKAFQQSNPNDRITFRLASGNVGVMAATNEEVEASQFPILGYVYAAVILLCLVSFRSLAATTCIIIPLATVSLLAYALMASLEIGLKVSTLPVVALGVGIGVDYGIYIYGRLRGNLAQGLDFATAYRRTLAVTGAGVTLTGLTLAGGVATWIIAPLKFQADMGTVLTFMFLVNMVGAVVLLPALGTWLIRVKRRNPEGAD